MAAERVVADTHALLWWLGDENRLSEAARRALDESASIWVSPITFWEVGMLLERDRITLDRPLPQWTNDLIASGEIIDAQMSAGVAALADTLAGFHGDPADRLIVATASALGIPLVTKDRTIRSWAQASAALDTIW